MVRIGKIKGNYLQERSALFNDVMFFFFIIYFIKNSLDRIKKINLKLNALNWLTA